MSVSTRRSVTYRVGLSILAPLVIAASLMVAQPHTRALGQYAGPLQVLFSVNPVKGGNTTTGTVSFHSNTFSYFPGATVLLTSSNPAVAKVPASVLLPASPVGTPIKVTFPVTTYKVTADQNVTIRADMGGGIYYLAPLRVTR